MLKLWTMVQEKLAQIGKDEEGASALEYAIVAAMVAVVLIAFIPGISTAVQSIFGDIETALTTATAG